MKKQISNGENTAREESKEIFLILKGYFKDDYEIIKHVNHDGKATYEHTGGSVLDTVDEEIETVILSLIQNLKFSAMKILRTDNSSTLGEEDDMYECSRAIENEIDHLEMRIREILFILKKCVGGISLERLYGNNSVYRDKRFIDAHLEEISADQDQDNGYSYDHDPELIKALRSLPPQRTGPLIGIINILKEGKRFQWMPLEG